MDIYPSTDRSLGSRNGGLGPSNRTSPDETRTEQHSACAITLSGITKRFGSTLALSDATLSVRPGTIHALLGANGAGKTTLMRIAFGMIQPDSGTITRHGRTIRFSSPKDAIAQGIGMVHQHFTLVPAMSVAENIALGGSGQFSPEEARTTVRELARRYAFEIDPDALIASLSVSTQQRVEILKAFARNAQILILDEPTAVLPPQDAESLLRHLSHYVSLGGTVILITHKLQDALRYATDITVLRAGKTVLHTPAHATSASHLANAMLGELAHTPDQAPVAPPANRPGTVAALDDVTYIDDRGIVRIKNATLHIGPGEIVGIAAVENNGQHELLRLLAGRLQPTTGMATIPRHVGFIPEDRHRDALVLDFTIADNVQLAYAGHKDQRNHKSNRKSSHSSDTGDSSSSRRGTRAWRIDWSDVRAMTRNLLSRYAITASPDTIVRTLSGGNQQRLVLARELARAHDLLIAENPSRGLDVRAAEFVEGEIKEVNRRGVAVVLYSSDIDDVVRLATRVLVMRHGVLMEVPREAQAIGAAMLGSPAGDPYP